MYTRQNFTWAEFSSTPSDIFRSGVAVNTNNNNVIYFAPDNAKFVGMYHPDNDTFSRINIDAVEYYLENGQVQGPYAYISGYSPSDHHKYSTSVFAPSNGNVYFIPYNHQQVGVLNTQTNVFSVILQEIHDEDN